MGKQQNIIAAVVTDSHIGSTLGLRPQYVTRDDGDVSKATRAQTWMLARWKDDYWAEVRERRKALDALLVLLFAGELFDNIHHGTTQLWSHNPADWYKAADELFTPIMEEVDQAFFLRGTEVHTGPSACLDEAWVNQWDNVAHDPTTDAATWWYLDIELEGVRIEGAHHGPIGRMEHTTGNALNKVASQVMGQAIKMGRKPPVLYFQAHNHVYAENNPAMPIRVVALPAWQLCTGYVSKVSPWTRLADIGGVILTCEDGAFDYDVRLYKPTPRRPWTLPKKP